MRVPKDPPQIDDHLVQSGRPPKTDGRHVNFPVEMGSTIVFDTLDAFEAARNARFETGNLYYGRYGNEASFALERMLAAMEGADGVTLTSSGVAAISASLIALTKPGDHLLVGDNVYGNTRALCDTVLAPRGVAVEYFDPMVGPRFSELILENTTAVMFEAPGSGTFEVADIPAIAKAARARNVVSVFDNTWATPIFCQPLRLGVDVVVSSGSKYLCGHSDAMLGTIAAREPHNTTIRRLAMAIGDKPGSQEIFLALRGARTLGMRMAHVDAAGRRMAEWFADQPEVKAVLHPALKGSPGHAAWERDFSGAAGLFGVIFHPCTDDQIRRFVDDLHHFGIGVSWGGFESLVLPVKPQRTAAPWTEDGQLVRFNIGFEDLGSLKADLASAFRHLRA